MPIEFKEDYSPPVSEDDIKTLLSNHLVNYEDKKSLVSKILRLLSEKRDSYQGILESILFVITSKDNELIDIMIDDLILLIVSKPTSYGGKMFLNKVLHRLTLKQPSFVIDLFDDIIKDRGNWSQHYDNDDKELLKLKIISLKAIKRAEKIDGRKSTALTDEEINFVCDDAINKCDDSTKIDTLSLIVESKRSTKQVDDRELQLYKIIIPDAIRLQNPALRQVFIALTNKLIHRIFASYRVVQRETKLSSGKERDNLRNRYRSFLTFVIEFCHDNIYCGAHFGSFVMTISILKIIIGQMKDFGDLFDINSLLGSKRSYDCVLCCLNDSFEQNKIMALDLILSLPYNVEFNSEKNLTYFEDIAFKLVASVNPAHSLSCQYLFKLVIGLKFRQEEAKKSKNKILLEQLNKLIKIVDESVEETKDNFIYALKSKPIYPKLTCIRALLDQIDINQIEEDREDWSKLARSIVDLSINACKAVSTIVCNLNPETIGHLPMDLKPVDIEALAKTLNVSLNISKSDLNTITSQMLLISGWKTIKECSLSLGTLCGIFWWPKEPIKKKKEKNPGFKTKPFLDNDDIIKIIEFFDHYLKNLRHRGAFEQAYNGFIMVTKRIWHDHEFRDLLIKNLEIIMNDFKSEALDDKKAKYLIAYVTRRSAGLPFIVQAILTSEHRHDSKILRWTLSCLFEIIENDNTETYQRIHCLNILIALIKEHNLGEKVLPFVGKTLAITMESFKSESFPIRNCANMLLKATMDRAFGVNRLRDDIHRRNQLSFERFFQECPDLQDIMVKHIIDSCHEDTRCFATLHSVYIILFRLTSKLNLDHNKFVQPFISPILRLTLKCADFKIREISAKLIIRLERFQQDKNLLKERKEFYKSIIRDVLSKELFESNQITGSVNELHGALLLLKNWIEVESDFADLVTEYISNMKRHVDGGKEIVEPIFMTTIDLFEAYFLTVRPSFMPENAEFLLDYMILKDHDLYFAVPFYENRIFKSIIVSLFHRYRFKHEPLHSTYQTILQQLDKIVSAKQDRIYSIDLQASLIRLIRQILYKIDCNEENDYIEALLDQLDIDLLTTFRTPFDRLKLNHENNIEKERLNFYCNDCFLKQYIKKFFDIKYFMRLEGRSEFQSLDKFENNNNYLQSANTARGVELLALNYVSFEDVLSNESNKKSMLTDRMLFMVDYLSRLPNCDIKCVALVFTGKITQACVENDINIIKELECFCKIIENSSMADNCLTIRVSCAKVLQLCFYDIIQMRKKSKLLGSSSLQNLFISLVNLCQDEDYEIRTICRQIVDRLRFSITLHQDDENGDTKFNSGNCLDYLMKLVVLEIFDPNQLNELQQCVELILNIIIHVDDCCYDNEFQDEEKEGLFDKTRINDFADNASLIEASVIALEIFFNRRYKQDNKNFIELNSLKLPVNPLLDLRYVESGNQIDSINFTGDYSIKRNTDRVEKNPNEFDMMLTNEQYFENLLISTLKSLDYFEDGYKNLLQDTSYSDRELSLYKNVAMIRFITKCTEYNPNINYLVTTVQKKIKEMIIKCCSTTLINKCFRLMN